MLKLILAIKKKLVIELKKISIFLCVINGAIKLPLVNKANNDENYWHKIIKSLVMNS